MAMLVGMIPERYQEMALQNHTKGRVNELQRDTQRDYLINLVEQTGMRNLRPEWQMNQVETHILRMNACSG